MKTKYKNVAVYALQGGGKAVVEGNSYVFIEVPNWGNYQVGDTVPEDWGAGYIGERYTLLPKPAKEYKSRNERETTFNTRHNHYNKRRKIRRKQRKNVRLALKETMRSTSRARIDALWHWVGVDMARDERRAARKDGKRLVYHKGDELRAVNIDDCGEGLRLKDICIVEEHRFASAFVTVRIRRNGKLKQLEAKRFILHKRFIENE